MDLPLQRSQNRFRMQNPNSEPNVGSLLGFFLGVNLNLKRRGSSVDRTRVPLDPLWTELEFLWIVKVRRHLVGSPGITWDHLEPKVKGR